MTTITKSFAASAFVVLSLNLLGSYLIKRPCVVRSWGGEEKIENRLFCYNDYQALYGVRHLDQKKFPYIQEKPYEYPPLIAIQMWLASLLSHDYNDFFLWNLPFQILWLSLTLFALLKGLGPNKRLYWFAGATPILLYSFMNWDASTLAALSLAFLFHQRNQWGLVGFFLGLGLCGKLFTLFAIPPLFIASMNGVRPSKSGFHLVMGVLVGWSLLNLPIMAGDLIINGSLDGWASVFKFHSGRLPEYDSIWHWISGIFSMSPVSWEYKDLVDKLSTALLGIGALSLLLWQWKTKRNPWSIFAATLCLVLLVSKIYSPQYSLWLLPTFVIIPTPVPLMLGFFASDLLEFISRFRWYLTMNTPDENVWKPWLGAAVYARCLFVILLMFFYAAFSKGKTKSTHKPQTR